MSGETTKTADEAIDLSDIPETSFAAAEIGKFYRPVKQQVTLRIDADVLAWFKAGHDAYQTEINRVLREHVLGQMRAERRKAAGPS